MRVPMTTANGGTEMLHMKTMLCDYDGLYVAGSLNFSKNSAVNGMEVSFATRDRGVLEEAQLLYEELWRRSEPISVEHWGSFAEQERRHRNWLDPNRPVTLSDEPENPDDPITTHTRLSPGDIDFLRVKFDPPVMEAGKGGGRGSNRVPGTVAY